MKIIMGADEAGYILKNAVKTELINKGYRINDVTPDQPMPFQEMASLVAGGVQSGEYERGIAMCGTGMGVSIVCNKYRGVYAALCESLYQAYRSRVVNNTNVLCMGGFITGCEMGIQMADIWLRTEHLERLSPDAAKKAGKEFQCLQDVERVIFSQ